MNYYQLDQCIEEPMNQVRVLACAQTVVNEQEILYTQGW